MTEYQKKENTSLPILRKQLKDVEKRIANMLDDIEQGFVNEFTEQRMDELGARKADLEIAIAQEKINNVPLTRGADHPLFQPIQGWGCERPGLPSPYG